MKQNRLVLTLLAAATMLLTACNSEETALDGLPEGRHPIRIIAVTVDGEPGAVSAVPQSRVDENTDGTGSVWTAGDKIGVAFTDANSVETKAVCPLNANGEGTVYDLLLDWSAGAMNVQGWYPAYEGETATLELFDQSGGLAYLLKSATTSVAAADEDITLAMSHQLAKVRIAFETVGISGTEGGISQVRILSLPTCTHQKGEVTASASTADYILMHPVTYHSKTYWEANLLPGTLSATDAVKFSLFGMEKTLSLDADVALEKGKLSTLSVLLTSAATQKINLADLTEDTTVDADAILTGTTSYKITLAAGVTVALNNATINGGIVCNGDANILLVGTNTVTTSSGAGIQVGPDGTTLTIDGEGQLTATGGSRAAGIGSSHLGTCGNITINGGTVTTTGGKYGAGIGSGNDNSTCGDIIINGGIVTATGGEYSAGIGSGFHLSTCANIAITGGTVTATGGERGAGMGGGWNSTCANIAITGGTVTATGGEYGAGMGSGWDNTCANIAITGGTVTATGGKYGAGIGSGPEGTCGDVTIDGVSGMSVKAGESAACVGMGLYGSVGTIKVTNSTVTLDKSASSSTYFDPTPSDITGSTFRDTQTGEVITSF
ncbi:MAG: fimbrillin family protein [Alloprevotella sp.]